MCLSAMGRSYTVEFNSMQQINEDTGTARPVQRKLNPLAGKAHQSVACAASMDPNVERCESRAEILKEDYDLASNFIQALFAVLYEICSTSAGPNIRHKCLQTILRMIYYATMKLPDVFSVYFRREGVMYQVQNITSTISQAATPTTPSPATSAPMSSACSSSSTSAAKSASTLDSTPPLAGPLNMSGVHHLPPTVCMERGLRGGHS